MSNETTGTTDERLTDEDIAELQRCVERSGMYADEWLISPDDVAALLADRASLVAEIAAMRPLVEAIANMPLLHVWSFTYCAVCGQLVGRSASPDVQHAPDCFAVQSRALVATWQTEPQPQKGDKSHAD